MSTTVYCTTSTPGHALAERRHNRDTNSAGAPLPRLPRRVSSSSASRNAAGSRMSSSSASRNGAGSRVSATTVSEKASDSDFLHSVSETPTHVDSAATECVTAAVVVQPPTPPQPVDADATEDGMTNQGGNASDSSSSSDGSQIVIASQRGNRIKEQPALSLSSSASALTPSPFAFPAIPENSLSIFKAEPMRFLDASSRPTRPRHQHSLSLDPTPVFSPHSGRSVSETPLETLARNKSGRPLKSSLKIRPQIPRTELPIFIPSKTSKSEPATPKTVHFDSQLEHVKLFISKQKPSAVSVDGSPTDDTSGTETGDWPSFIFGGGSAKENDAERTRKNITMSVCHFPDAALRRHEDVVLEELSLASDATTIHGRVRVRNLAFEKFVVARFTFDEWQTTSEVATRYIDSIEHGSYDRFSFSIRINDLLPRIEEKTMYLALKYVVAGREIWDNNGGRDYQVTFARKALPAPAKPQPQALQRLPRSARRRAIAMPLSDEDVADLTGKLQEVARLNADESPITTAEGDASPMPFGTTPSGDHFSFKSDPLTARYDFATSARQPWRPSELQRAPRTSPGHMRTDTHPPTHPSQAGWPTSGPIRPSFSRKALVNAFTIGSRTPPSPRVANEDGDLSLASTRKYAGYDDEDDSGNRLVRVQSRRNHQRGYFDLQPQNFGLGPESNLRRTQPGTPGAPLAGLGALARYNSFPQTEDEEARSASASPAGTPGIPNLAPASVSARGTGPGLASTGNVACPVPGKAMNLLLPPWNASLVLPGTGEIGGSEDSTPSITSGESSRSTSPNHSPSELVTDMLARSAPERATSPVDQSYSAFLNQFCFFTGLGAVHTPSDIQRSHSASSVEQYFSTPPSRSSQSWGNAPSPLDTPSRPSSADSIRTAGSAATLQQ